MNCRKTQEQQEQIHIARQPIFDMQRQVYPDEEVLRRCSELKSAGYMLVLDDFVYKKERLPLVELADIVKIDFRATSAAERQQWQDFLTPYDLRLLAEKVETEEEFQEARAAGYTYVQGYYFSKPALVSGNALPACKANHFKLLQEFSRSDLEFGQIEAVLRKDVSLSYNLMQKYEQGQWQSAAAYAQKIELSESQVLLGYREALNWAQDVFTGNY